MGATAHDLLTTVLPRQELLIALAEGPKSKPELTERCDISRSTVNRGINTLIEEGLVQRVERSRYDLTLFGAIVQRDLERVNSRLETVAAVRELLTELGEATDLEAELFDEATIRPPEGMGITAAVDAFKGADRLRIVDPPFGVIYMLVVAKPDALAGIETEILVREDMVAEIQAIDSQVADAEVDTEVDLRRTGEQLPFSFGLAEYGDQSVLYIVLQNRQGSIAIVRSEESEALDWGEDLYGRLATGSVPIAQVLQGD